MKRGTRGTVSTPVLPRNDYSSTPSPYYNFTDGRGERKETSFTIARPRLIRSGGTGGSVGSTYHQLYNKTAPALGNKSKKMVNGLLEHFLRDDSTLPIYKPPSADSPPPSAREELGEREMQLNKQYSLPSLRMDSLIGRYSVSNYRNIYGHRTGRPLTSEQISAFASLPQTEKDVHKMVNLDRYMMQHRSEPPPNDDMGIITASAAAARMPQIDHRKAFSLGNKSSANLVDNWTLMHQDEMNHMDPTGSTPTSSALSPPKSSSGAVESPGDGGEGAPAPTTPNTNKEKKVMTFKIGEMPRPPSTAARESLKSRQAEGRQKAKGDEIKEMLPSQFDNPLTLPPDKVNIFQGKHFHTSSQSSILENQEFDTEGNWEWDGVLSARRPHVSYTPSALDAGLVRNDSSKTKCNFKASMTRATEQRAKAMLKVRELERLERESNHKAHAVDPYWKGTRADPEALEIARSGLYPMEDDDGDGADEIVEEQQALRSMTIDNNTTNTTNTTKKDYLSKTMPVPTSTEKSPVWRPLTPAFKAAMNPKKRVVVGRTATPKPSRILADDELVVYLENAVALRNTLRRKFGYHAPSKRKLVRSLVPPFYINAPSNSFPVLSERLVQMDDEIKKPSNDDYLFTEDEVPPARKPWKQTWTIKDDDKPFIPPKDYDPAHKHRWKIVERMTEKNKKKAFFREWEDIYLQDILQYEDQKMKTRELNGLKKVVYEFFDAIRRVFTHYSCIAARSKFMGFMNCSTFLFCCKHMKIAGDTKGKLSGTDLTQLFKLVNLNRDDDDEGKIHTNHEHMDDNPDEYFTRPEFIESMVRLAIIKFPPRTGGVVASFAKFMEKYFLKNVYEPIECNLTFRDILWKGRYRRLIYPYEKKLYERFQSYAAGNQYATDDHASLDFQEFEMLAADFELIGPHLSRRACAEAFSQSLDENILDDTFALRYSSFIELIIRIAHIRGGAKIGTQRELGQVEKMFELITGPKLAIGDRASSVSLVLSGSKLKKNSHDVIEKLQGLSALADGDQVRMPRSSNSNARSSGPSLTLPGVSDGAARKSARRSTRRKSTKSIKSGEGKDA